LSGRDRKRRLVLCAVAVCAVWAAIAARAFEVQLVRGDRYRVAAEKQQRSVRVKPGRRGGIYDRELRPLASNLTTVTVFADPELIEDRDETARGIARAVGGGASDWRERLSDGGRFVRVARGRSRDEATDILRSLPELSSYSEPRRFYPLGRTLSHLLGGCDVDNRGLEGLERAFDSHLSGRPDSVLVLRSAMPEKYPTLEIPLRPSRPGGRLVLTIDADLQTLVEDELSAAVARHGCESGVAILSDARTGEVLAWAVSPDFDPNEPWAYSASTRRNRTITDVFEPGSTFKVVAVAAALESGALSIGDVVDCGGGQVSVRGRTIRDHAAYGKLTLAQVLAYSSNVGAIRAARRAGGSAFSRAVADFGFGQPTGIGLPGEARGILQDLYDDPFDLASSAIGQGIAVTPLQLLSAYGAIANGGRLMRPYVVRAIVDADGRVISAGQPHMIRQAISPSTARALTEGLTMVVDSGTATLARVRGLSIAGKTGTAQVASESGGGYAPGRYVASFAGFFPAESPVYVGIVVLYRPSGDYYAGHTAAPVFANIARRVAATELCAGTAPSVLANEARGPVEAAVVPDVRGMHGRAAARVLDASGFNAVSVSGTVTAQEPRAGARVPPGTNVVLSVEHAGDVVPDVRGLGVRAACARLLAAGLVPSVRSGGMVVSQSPAAGSVRPENGLCRLVTVGGGA
jgi:cell division protein FtsI/penicillin-binding protein 2